jgi:hypothetical protein
MAYCRFGENSDVYLFGSMNGGYECCACRLAPLVPTIFTKGEAPWLKGPCKHCGGNGCQSCLMHDSTMLKTPQDAVDHMLAHRKAGHRFRWQVIPILKAEARGRGRRV